MNEREQELHDMVEERAGVTPPRAEGRHAAARRPVRRARRAEG
jgi:hypothetical protein